jgi:hypothetical protein
MSLEFVARRWKKGQGDNPRGCRGSTYAEVIGLARENSLVAMSRLVRLMESKDERIAFVAAQAVLDRAFGRAPKRVVLEESSDADERRRAVTETIVRALNQMAGGTHLSRPGPPYPLLK